MQAMLSGDFNLFSDKPKSRALFFKRKITIDSKQFSMCLYYMRSTFIGGKIIAFG